MPRHFLFEKSYRGLFVYSLPSIFATLLSIMHSLVDSHFIGNLSSSWLASLALGVSLLSFFEWTGGLLQHVSTQGFSKCHSLSEKERLKKRAVILKSAIIIALFFSLICTLILFFFGRPLLLLFGEWGEGSKMSLDYVQVRSLFIPFHFLFLVFIGALRGLGRVNLSFLMVAISFILNISLTWFFIKTKFLGWNALESAAMGTGLSQMLSASFLFFLLKDIWRQKTPFSIEWEMKEKSWNLFVRSFFLIFSFLVATSIAKKGGEVFLAGHHVFVQIWLFVSYLIDGIAVTGTVLISDAFGRNSRSEVKDVGKKLIIMSFIIGCICSLLFYLFHVEILYFFTPDKEIHALVLSFFWPLIPIRFNKLAAVCPFS